ncbi:MAG: MATE family efflux transporter [Brevibacillus sp.]|nr:MATE family efflux transporter [Brevibacillus sp.]
MGRSRLLSLAVPAMLEMLLTMMVMFADTLMISPLGPASLAASGIANQVFFILILVLSVIGIGCNVLVAHAFGAKQEQQVKQVLEQSLFTALLAGLLLVAAVAWATPFLLALFQAEPTVHEMGSSYLAILSCSIPFLAFSLTIGAYLRGIGNMKTPMLVALFANLVNIVGNYLLIYGTGPLPALGINGSAVATLIARIAGLAVLVTIVQRSLHRIGPGWLRWRTHQREVYRSLLAVGGPAALSQAGYHVGQVVMLGIVALVGTNAIAARQISLSVESLSFLPGLGISIAITSIVGQHLGAREITQSYQEAAAAIKWAVGIMSAIGLFLFCSAEFLVGMFTDDQEVAALTVLCLQIMAVAQPAKAANMVLDGIFRGAAKTRWSLYVTLSGVWVWSLPLAYLIGIQLGWALPGIFVVISLEEWLRAAANLAFFFRKRWLMQQPSTLHAANGQT